MKGTIPTKAVIYARVSSVKQTVEGNGLSSQETRCREYAARLGYEVVETFCDDVSGKLADRPGMTEMLAFLKKRRKEPHVILIDNLNRLARSIETHLQLRDAIRLCGGRLESPSFKFGDDPDSLFLERLMALVAELDRQKNAQQTHDRMRARLQNGYWCFAAGPGYRFQAVRGQGKVLVRDEPVASIVAEALEGFASGRFQTQTEVVRFLENQPEYPKNKKGKVRIEQVRDLLTNPVNAGYVLKEDWGVSLTEGHHEGLISFATFKKNQERLAGKSYAPARKDIREDFPLRGAVCCAECEKPLRAGNSKGRTKSYTYYLCHTASCSAYGKSILKADIEGRFEKLLQSVQPKPPVFDMAKAMLRDIWDANLAGGVKQHKALEAQIKDIESKIEKYVERVVDAERPSLIAAYENKIVELEEQGTLLREKLGQMAAKDTSTPGSFDELYRTALEFLANPLNLWRSGKIEEKRAVLKMTFDGHLTYDREDGYRTAKTTLPFKALREICMPDYRMVGAAGIEPATPAV